MFIKPYAIQITLLWSHHMPMILWNTFHHNTQTKTTQYLQSHFNIANIIFNLIYPIYSHIINYYLFFMHYAYYPVYTLYSYTLHITYNVFTLWHITYTFHYTYSHTWRSLAISFYIHINHTFHLSRYHISLTFLLSFMHIIL